MNYHQSEVDVNGESEHQVLRVVYPGLDCATAVQVCRIRIRTFYSLHIIYKNMIKSLYKLSIQC